MSGKMLSLIARVLCLTLVFGTGVFACGSAASPAQGDRFLHIGKLKNARQLGGYIGAEGRRVKDGLLIRTEGLDGLSGEDAAELAQRYSVSNVVDFRMGYERKLAADQEIPGAQNEWISVYEMDMSDPENVELMKRIGELESPLQKSVEYAKTGKLASLYTEILLSERGQQGYARFFDILLHADGAVIWHCTYGKDRTGVAAALVLYALGVDEDTIMQDFLLTNTVYAQEIAQLEAGLRAAGYDDAVVGEAQAMAGVKGEYLQAALDAVKREYGSVEDYIRNQLGVSDGELQQLREKYLYHQE